MSNLRFIKNLIYSLKRRYPATVTIRKVLEPTYNLVSGAITRKDATAVLNKVIVLPVNMTRKFEYDLSFLAANKNFVMGGLFDTNTRIILIDGKDLTTRPDVNDEIVYNTETYSITEVETITENYGYIVIMQRVKGQV